MKMVQFISICIVFVTACNNHPLKNNSAGVDRSNNMTGGVDRYAGKDSFTISAAQFPEYLHSQYVYDSAIEKSIPAIARPYKKVVRDQIKTGVIFSSEKYKVTYELDEYKKSDSAVVKLYVNDKIVPFYDPETNLEEPESMDIEFIPNSKILLYDWPERKFIMITGFARDAQSWYRGVLYSILIDISANPMKAFLLGTYEVPGDYYFKLNKTNGQLTFLSAIPFFGEKGKVDSLTISVGRISK
ncbi:hypothetical protein [Chitinophaga sp. HK235]|uniref:hypothetical protein n=1 Tax=Chitinophaga sp. HK235 TaxID=2952571 RepID=UPI001BAA9836|nr:hypothetical protein [Chitinophaga sp. HK235]